MLYENFCYVENVNKTYFQKNGNANFAREFQSLCKLKKLM